MSRRRLHLDSMEDLARALRVEPGVFRGGLNLVEAAGLLGVAPSTLRQRALDGRISHQRDGRRWIFTWADLADYVERRQVLSNESRRAEPDPGTEGHSSSLLSDETVEAEAVELGLI
jgi:excisionase family DNA binding protein